jgi:hypothetical protein
MEEGVPGAAPRLDVDCELAVTRISKRPRPRCGAEVSSANPNSRGEAARSVEREVHRHGDDLERSELIVGEQAVANCANAER